MCNRFNTLTLVLPAAIVAWHAGAAPRSASAQTQYEAVAALMAGPASLVAQVDMGTAFTYQGQLKYDGLPVTDMADFRFTLWDASTLGNPVSGTLVFDGQVDNPPPITVVDGLFTVVLDFGPDVFTGWARWLEIEVRSPHDPTDSLPYTMLSPRQEMTPAAYALHAPSAASAPWDGLYNVPPGFADDIDDDVLGALLCAPGQVVKWDDDSVAWECADDLTGTGSFWSLSGNAGTAPGVDFLGTTDNVGLEIRVDNATALRIEPAAFNLLNLIGGYPDNYVTPGAGGATIAGGGSSGLANRVTDYFGTVSGGVNNQAGDADGLTDNRQHASVGGGYSNTASGTHSTVGGGYGNTASGNDSTVGGGNSNQASGTHSTVGGGYINTASGGYSAVGGGASNDAGGDNSTVGGGNSNTASGNSCTVGGGWSNTAGNYRATVGGGDANTASGNYAVVAGGHGNTASGIRSMIPGGMYNKAGGDYSFAAGRQAKVRDPIDVGGGDTNGDEGTFVWADSTAQDFTSTGPNQFLIRASGGVGIGTDSPTAQLSVGPSNFSYGIFSYGIRSEQVGVNGGSAVYGEQTYPSDVTYPTFGGYFKAAGKTAAAVYGEATNTIGEYPYHCYGGWFKTAAPMSAGARGEGITYGLNGQATGAGGVGVRGDASDTGASANYGGKFYASSEEGCGVYGKAQHGAGETYGGYFEAVSSSGTGVYGEASDDGYGPTYGGYFTSAAEIGRGVYAQATGGTGRAVIAEAHGTYGIGLYAEGGETGVKAIATGAVGTGIYAQGGPSGGLAGEFYGDVHVDGTAQVDVLAIVGADLAEEFPFNEAARPGMVVAIDPKAPGYLRLPRQAYDRCVAGVIAGANDFPTGVVLGKGSDAASLSLPVALNGRVWVYCDAQEAPIQPGDLLTTSDTPGYAMKVTDVARAQGAVIGKAMTSLDGGKGLVLALVSLQ